MKHLVPIALAALPLAGCATTPDAPAITCPRSDNWQVWIDAMPDPDKDLALYVDGEVDVPAGMVASVTPGPLDKSMPPGQRFTLELRRGKGPSGPQRVRGRARPAQLEYREVIVTCGDETLAVVRGADIETAD